MFMEKAHPALGRTGIAKHHKIKKHSYKTHTLLIEFTFLIGLPGVAMKQYFGHGTHIMYQ